MIEQLESLGLVTPRDPSEPDTPIIADWSLHVVHAWTQPLESNVETNVVVGFMPIKAVYTIEAASLAGFDALKQQACLTPQIMNAAKALLSVKGSTADVADITLANDGPARWLDNRQRASRSASRRPIPSWRSAGWTPRLRPRMWSRARCPAAAPPRVCAS